MDLSSVVAVFSDPKFIAFAAPLLVAGAKKVIDVLPSWSLPLLATVIGGVCSAVGGGDPSTGVAAGLAGVGIREVLDQAKKKISA